VDGTPYLRRKEPQTTKAKRARDVHSDNRVAWRSTLRYAATAKRKWKRDIVRLLTLRKWLGTAFGTAWLVELALSADDALLFRPVRPLHHRRDAEAMGISHTALL
jgi:hypothetical protein